MKIRYKGHRVMIVLASMAWLTITVTAAPASEALLNKLVEKGILDQREESP